ncbi:MAG: DNA-directed RNA polymerase subunit delta [Lachnospiraceae bacterium]|nr:DNA-directed RNA polymerase subunit delta [Lachnospiraceae bacterium]
MKKNKCLIGKLIALAIAIAAIAGALYLFKDSIAEVVAKIKEKLGAEEDFDEDVADEDFDDEEIFADKDREYVNIKIGDDSVEETAEEEIEEASEEVIEEETEEAAEEITEE